MGLKGKLVIETEIKGSAEKYYNVMKSEAHNFPTISPEKIAAIKLHEGDWNIHGSLRLWNYTIGGKDETVIEKIEHCGDMTVSLEAMEGDVLTHLKRFKVIVQAIPSPSPSDGSCDMVKLTVDYEKRQESSPVPFNYFEYINHLFIDDLDAHLVST